MSTKIKCKALFVAAVVLLVAVSLTLHFSVSQRGLAATVTETVFEDDFSDVDTSEKWVRNDFDFTESSTYSMRFDNHASFGAAVFFKAYTVQGDCEITFDFRQSDRREGSVKSEWFAFLFGGSDASAHLRGCRGAILSDARPYTQYVDDQDGTYAGGLNANSYNDPGHPKERQALVAATYDDDSVYSVSVEITSMNVRRDDGQNLYTVTMTYAPKNGGQSASYTVSDVAADGYFGFSSMAHATFDISDFAVWEDGKKVIGADFADPDTGEGVKIVSTNVNSQWKTCNYSDSKLFSYYNGSMNLGANKNGMLVSNFVLQPDVLCEKTFELSFEANIASLPANSSFGVVTGLESASSAIGDGDYFAVCGLGDGKFRFVHKRGDNVVKETNVLGDFILYKETPARIRLIGYYDGSVEMQLNGYAVNFTGVDASGRFAVATAGESACDVGVDNLYLDADFESVSFAGNMGTDFSGTKATEEDDFTYYQRYIDERLWYLGKKVTLPRVYSATNNYMQFTDSNEQSFFGPKRIYSEFICRFAVTVTQNAADSVGAHIGLSFGKSARDEAASDSPSVMFGKTANGMTLEALNCSIEGNSSGTVLQPSELDFWSSEDWTASTVTYRITVIVRGGKAYVYYAESGADASEMEICRAVLYGMQTRGYVTVSAYGGATFRLRDFSVTNIAKTASGVNGNGSECVSVDFSDEKLYSVAGSSLRYDRGLSLGNSASVTPAGKYKNFLAYLDLNGVAGDCITVLFGDESLRLNGDGGIYSEMTKESGGKSLPFSKLGNGGTVMIQALGEYVAVSVIGDNQPLSLLETPVAVYKTSRRTAAENVTVKTGENAVLSLSGMRLYSLDPTIEHVADNWEPADDEWPDKLEPTAQELAELGIATDGGKDNTVAIAVGCSVAGAVVVAAAVVVTVLLLKKKKGKSQNEKEQTNA